MGHNMTEARRYSTGRRTARGRKILASAVTGHEMTVSPRRVEGPHGLNELAIAGIRYLLVGVSSKPHAGLTDALLMLAGALAGRSGSVSFSRLYESGFVG